MSTSRLKQIEARLTLQQRQAALMLVENELNDTGTRLTQEEIADKLGVTRQGLYKWRTQNKAFIEYKNLLADDFFSEMRPVVYRQLMRLIIGPQPSVKAIDLFMRRFGMLTDKTVVETLGDGNGRSDEELTKELEDIDALLAEAEKEEG